ncbi:MAG: 50S ribosomal protein L3 [Planctomycetota bacterium]|jgi:large subunit ribosomal protein L3|nr:MAG: 50S ribosomal protein L3 [Planctomycetota bacterium]
MPVGLLGRKIGMTQVYGPEGQSIGVTVLEVGPCHVLQLRSVERDGYEAVQVGFADKLSRKDLARDPASRQRSRATRGERGQVVALAGKKSKAREASGVAAVPKAGCEPQRFIREFRTDGEQHGCEVGQVLTANALEGVSYVDVIGTSKGRGFSGVMRRHNFSGQRASHGVKKCHRKPGGIGAATDPSRVWKGKRMAGRFGGDRRTTRNLKVMRIDAENHMLLVSGPVAGPNGGFVVIRKAR